MGGVTPFVMKRYIWVGVEKTQFLELRKSWSLFLINLQASGL